jgi:hypothetical protein
MKKERNEVYVVNQPQKALMSIVLIGKNEYPLSERIHNRLYELSCISDLFFIFHGEGNRGINEDKFCNLYSACGWMISRDSLPETFIRAGKYGNEIFKTPAGYLVVPDVYDLPDIAADIIQKINASGLVQPIFKERRLGTDEFYQIYNSPADIVSKLTRPTDGLDKKYSIWTSESNTIFLRPDTFGKFETLPAEYIKSFSWSDIRYFIASAVKKLLIGNTNSNVEDLDLGSL